MICYLNEGKKNSSISCPILDEVPSHSIPGCVCFYIQETKHGVFIRKLYFKFVLRICIIFFIKKLLKIILSVSIENSWYNL